MKKPRRSSHHIGSFADGGRIIVLDDGSAWLIQPDDRARAGAWELGASVEVSMPGHPDSLFANLDNGTSARAVYAGQR